MDRGPKTNDIPSIEYQPEAQDPKDDEVKKIWGKFVESSTIPAITLINQRISIVWKILWLCVVGVGLGMSIYQSVELIKNYMRRPSTLIEVEQMNRSQYFPSITLSYSNKVNWSKAKTLYPSLFNKKMNGSGDDSDEILNEIHSLSRSERDKILFHPADWLKICVLQKLNGRSIDCKTFSEDFMVPVYSPFYGWSMTINPGFKGKFRLKEDTRSTLTLIIELPDDTQYSSPSTPRSISVVIHGPGTAPVLPFNQELTVLPGGYFYASFSVYEINRLPHPFASNCTSHNDPISTAIVEASPYAHNFESNKYEYSLEECAAFCLQSATLEEYKCVNSLFATDPSMDEITKKICRLEELDENFMEEVEDNVCNEFCHKRCHEFIYDWTPISYDIPQENNFVSGIFKVLHPDSDISEYNETEYLNRLMIISLKMESPLYKVGTEEAKYELQDVLGSIGGNLGLWIGVSMLSFFEIIELVLQLFALCICRRVKRADNK